MAIHVGMEAYGPKVGKRLTFVWDIEKSQSFLFDVYREGLNQWKKEHKKQVGSKNMKILK